MTPKAEARLEWLLGYYKAVAIGGLGCAGLIVLVVGGFFVLMLGTCAVAVHESERIKDVGNASQGIPTSEAEMAKQRRDIERSLNRLRLQL